MSFNLDLYQLFTWTISPGKHSAGKEITFFAVRPAPIDINPIKNIHFDLSVASSWGINLIDEICI